MAMDTGELFPWSEAYSVNIGIFDRQHRNLASFGNALQRAIAEGEGETELKELLSLLIKYAHVHFATEELLMQIHGYPDFPVHKAAHDGLALALADLQHKFQRNEIALTMQTLASLRDWGVEHILSYDKKYAPFLNSKGVF